MGFGHLTKQLAQQAIGNSVKEAVEGIVPSTEVPVATPPSFEGLGPLVLGELHAMQKGLKDDQELVVTCSIGTETLRVREIYAPTPRLAVLTGTGADKALTRVICPFDLLQLVCKPAVVQPGVKAVRVRIVTPKAE